MDELRIDKELADDLTWIDSVDGFNVVARQYHDRSRWAVHYLLVISDMDGRSWGAVYRSPATEMQEIDDPFDRWGKDDVVFLPVVVSMVPEYGLVA